MTSLKGKEKALEPDHTSMLMTVNNLAVPYEDQGRLDEAEALYERALQGFECAFRGVSPEIPNGPMESTVSKTISRHAYFLVFNLLASKVVLTYLRSSAKNAAKFLMPRVVGSCL